MLWKDLKLTDQAPGSGQMLVYLRNEVLFQPYTSLAQVQEIVGHDRYWNYICLMIRRNIEVSHLRAVGTKME